MQGQGGYRELPGCEGFVESLHGFGVVAGALEQSAEFLEGLFGQWGCHILAAEILEFCED